MSDVELGVAGPGDGDGDGDGDGARGRATGALGGVKVLDVATLYPAPLLAAMLGDLGADVVKIEAPEGDALRRVGAIDDDGARAHRFANRNKRSVVLDLDTAAGIDTLAALTSVADVVVVNQTDAQLARWKCTYAEIAARNPRAVVVSLTAFGATGPWAGRGGNGSIAEAFGGFAHLNGSPDGPPTLPSAALGDTVGAIVALNGALAALYWRDTDEGRGRGQFVDASLSEAVLSLLGATFAGWRAGEPVPTRHGSRIAAATPRNVYRTGDGRFVVVSAPTDGQVARVLALIGRTDEAARTRFGDAASRVGEAADELDGAVADWVGARALEAVVDAMEHARIPIAVVQTPTDLLAHAHIAARESLVPLPGGGATIVPAPHPRLSATPSRLGPSGPALIGADTDAVLQSWLDPRA